MIFFLLLVLKWLWYIQFHWYYISRIQNPSHSSITFRALTYTLSFCCRRVLEMQLCRILQIGVNISDKVVVSRRFFFFFFLWTRNAWLFSFVNFCLPLFWLCRHCPTDHIHFVIKIPYLTNNAHNYSPTKKDFKKTAKIDPFWYSSRI